MDPDRHDLVQPEGVNAGSARLSAEDPPEPPLDDIIGAAPTGQPHTDTSPAPPVEMEDEQTRTARLSDPGQQLAEGEG